MTIPGYGRANQPIVALALHSLLVNRLQNCLLDLLSGNGFEAVSNDRSLIELKQARTYTSIQYATAIALRLAASGQHPQTALIATALAERWNQETQATDSTALKPELATQIWRWVNAEVVASGQIVLRVQPHGLAVWLQQLVTLPAWTESDCAGQQFKRISTREQGTGNREQGIGNREQGTGNGEEDRFAGWRFELQRHHARCCMLLRLGEEAGHIALTVPPAQSLLHRFLTPVFLPWLTVSGQMRLNQPEDQQLIHRVCQTLDRLTQPAPTRDRLKLAISLSQAFAAMEAKCQLGRITHPESIALVQARLGLVAITQWILRWLLEVELGEAAIVEL